MNVGVQMFTLRRFTQNEADLVATLERLADIGFESIQMSAFGPMPLMMWRATAGRPTSE